MKASICFVLGGIILSACGNEIAPDGNIEQIQNQTSGTSPTSAGNSDSSVVPPPPEPPPPANTPESPSVVAFRQTLFPLALQQCEGCHANTAPQFAIRADATASHDRLLQPGALLVNLTTPTASRLVTVVSNIHYSCPNAVACAQQAQSLLTQINAWKALLNP